MRCIFVYHHCHHIGFVARNHHYFFFVYRESLLSERGNSNVASYQSVAINVEPTAPISCHPAIKEIIDTEEVYLNDLNITINEIKKSLTKEMVN